MMNSESPQIEQLSFPALLLYGVRQYLFWHISLIDACYRNTIWRLDGKAFCTVFNVRAMLRGKSIRFSFNPISKNYTAQSEGLLREFKSKYAAIGGYSNGLRARGESIGAAYHLKYINFSEGDLVVDCGANIGDLKLYFDIHKIAVQYIAFEPSPTDFNCLKNNVQPSEARNIGLWNCNDELTFYVSTHNADSSIIKPANYTQTISIKVSRLDELLDKQIKLLKIEAEGAEPEVLQGCENILGNIEYISVDLGFERGIEMESTLVPVTNYLLGKGFKLVEIGYPRIVALFKNTSA